MREAYWRYYAADARPLNLGISVLRFTAPDAKALATSFAAKGIVIAAPLQPLAITARAKRLAFAVVGPEVVWLEFVEING